MKPSGKPLIQCHEAGGPAREEAAGSAGPGEPGGVRALTARMPSRGTSGVKWGRHCDVAVSPACESSLRNLSEFASAVTGASALIA